MPDEEIAAALDRLEEQARTEARRRRRPAARVGAKRRARVDARDARHRPEPRPQRRVGGGPHQGDRQRALRLGLLPALRADVRERLPRHPRRALPGPDQAAEVRRRRERGRGARRRPPEDAHASSSRSSSRRRRASAFPQDPKEQLRQAITAVFDSWTGQARGGVPAHQPHPGRLGHGRERAADGVRQQGRQLVLRRGLLARRDHRRAEAVGRLPAERPGRGRGVGRAHAARPARHEGVDARGPRRPDGDPAHAREALRRHAGHGVHRGGGQPLHAPDPQRQAAGAGGGEVRGRCRGGGPARPRAGDRHDRRRTARRAAPPGLQARRRLRGPGRGRARLAGRRQGRDRLHGRRRRERRRGRPRRDPRASLHRGRRRGRLPRREGHPHRRGRQGEPRGAGGARDGEALRVGRRRRSTSTCTPRP